MNEVWDLLHDSYQNTIVQAFRKVRMSLHLDGFEVGKVQVKGPEGILVGNYRREDYVDKPPTPAQEEDVADEADNESTSEDSDFKPDSSAPTPRTRQAMEQNWQYFERRPVEDFQPEILEGRRAKIKREPIQRCYYTAAEANAATSPVVSG